MGKVISQTEASVVIAKARKAAWRIVLTNGCFDVLHRGHFETLRFAKKQGQVLFVAVNTDEAVRALKGPHRPIHKCEDRMAMVAAISGVDYVLPFGTAESPSVEPLVEALSPDVLVKGGDYAPDGVVGAALVENRGGLVIIAPKIPGVSTTESIKHLAMEIGATERPAQPWRVLVDLDGVLVDFFGSMAKALNLPWEPRDCRGEYDPGRMFALPTDLFSLFGPDFWEAADPMPDGLAILKAACDAVGRDQVWLCSSPTHESSSAMGKLRWVEKHLDIHWGRRYIFTPDKFLLANERTILIDDCDEQLRRFRGAGGCIILVPRPWNAGWNDACLASGEWVAAQLASILRSENQPLLRARP